jgi:hypothetical protein
LGVLAGAARQPTVLSFAAVGVLLLAGAIYWHRVPALEPGDEVTALAPLAEADLVDLKDQGTILLAATAPDNTVWTRIRKAWGEPGYFAAVLASDGITVLCLEQLALRFEVMIGEKTISAARATEPPYGLTCQCQGNGVWFRAAPGSRMKVRIGAQNVDPKLLGSIVLAPYWRVGIRDQIVRLELDRQLWIPLLRIARASGWLLLLFAGLVAVVDRKRNRTPKKESPNSKAVDADQ